MENQITLTRESQTMSLVAVASIIISNITERINACFESLAIIYSDMLDEEVSVQKTKAMVNAQFAFIALIMPVELGLLYRFVAVAWFALAVWRCREY